MLVQQNFLTTETRARLAAACGITIICGALVIVGAALFIPHPLASLVTACAVAANVAAELVLGSIHEGGRRKFFLAMASVTGLMGLAHLDAYFGFPVLDYLFESVHLGALTSSTLGASVGLGMQ